MEAEHARRHKHSRHLQGSLILLKEPVSECVCVGSCTDESLCVSTKESVCINERERVRVCMWEYVQKCLYVSITFFMCLVVSQWKESV